VTLPVSPPRTEFPRSDIRIGPRLRSIRKQRGLTIEQLADRARLTGGFISQLERDQTSVSLSSLARICDVLGCRIGDLTDPRPQSGIVRKKDRERGALLRDHDHFLLSGSTERRLHVAESHIRPGGTAGEVLYTLPADVELVYVLEGTLELRVKDDIHVLEGGDSFTYSPRDPHTWRNPSETDDVVVVWFAVPNPY
jgi:transcriptional regulator with XRE-family HTH domain